MSGQYHLWIKLQKGKEQPLLCHAPATPESIQTIIAKLEQALSVAKGQLSKTSTQSCPLCGRVMIQRTGKYGSFYVCCRSNCAGKRNGDGSIPQSVVPLVIPEEEVEDVLDLLEIE